MMLRPFIGAVLIAAAGLLAGNLAAGCLQGRAEDLRSLEAALRALQAGVCVSRTPLPELLERGAKRLSGAGGELFAAAAAAAQPDLRFAEQWQRGIAACSRCRDAAPVLLELGDVLGQYDAPQQEAALEAAIARMEDLSRVMEQNCEKNGPLCRKLGLTAGIFLAILLL